MLLPDGVPNVNPIIFGSITIEEIRKSSIRTKGESAPSRLNTDGWRKVLTSTSYGESTSNVCQMLARLIKNLCAKKLDSTNLKALLSCRLTPLDKNPGVRKADAGEILRQIAGRVVIAVTRIDVITSVETLQVCVGHYAGSEALVHSMRSGGLLVTFVHSFFFTPPRLFAIGWAEISSSEGMRKGGIVAMA